MAGAFGAGINAEEGDVGAELRVDGEAGVIDVGAYLPTHDVAWGGRGILSVPLRLDATAVDLGSVCRWRRRYMVLK